MQQSKKNHDKIIVCGLRLATWLFYIVEVVSYFVLTGSNWVTKNNLVVVSNKWE